MRSHLAVLLCMTGLALGQASTSNNASSVTQTSAELGTCSADFTVTDAQGKPLPQARIATRVRYGAMGLKRLDLELYTSYTGQARVIGLPEVPKRPIYFDISKDEKTQTIEFHPEEKCKAQFNVQLK